jgi:hypothetical protein
MKLKRYFFLKWKKETQDEISLIIGVGANPIFKIN